MNVDANVPVIVRLHREAESKASAMELRSIGYLELRLSGAQFASSRNGRSVGQMPEKYMPLRFFRRSDPIP
jgi:hypothetical protein